MIDHWYGFRQLDVAMYPFKQSPLLMLMDGGRVEQRIKINRCQSIDSIKLYRDFAIVVEIV